MNERDSDDDENMESMFPKETRDESDDESDDGDDELPEILDNIDVPPNLKTLSDIIEPNDDTDVSDDDEESNDDEDEYTSKFTKEVNTEYIQRHHPECLHINYDEMEILTNVVRDNNGVIIDDLHRTPPIMTKYEYTRILGQRAMQIENGSKPYIEVADNVMDGYVIATQELYQKKIPIILRRPLGKTFEYWKLKDLEIII